MIISRLPASSRWSSIRRLRTFAALLCLAVGAAASGPAPSSAAPEPILLATPETGLELDRDVFDFVNGLRWTYSHNATQARAEERRSDNVIDQRCSQMARAVRQFFYASRFEPEAPVVSEEEYARLVDRVMKSSFRHTEKAADPIVIPGFADLRSFSAAYPDTVKRSLGGSWRTYYQRGNWRMIFAFSPKHQRRTAESLLASLEGGRPPIVHVVRFPHITVNHTLLLYRAEATATEIRFLAYDPNDPQHEVSLRYDRGDAQFDFQRTSYWRGGPVSTYEVFRDFLY
jgi:hypothetical protein